VATTWLNQIARRLRLEESLSIRQTNRPLRSRFNDIGSVYGVAKRFRALDPPPPSKGGMDLSLL
jgi:hypothetical protein